MGGHRAAPDVVAQQIQFALSKMSARNAHHEFEQLCEYFARERIDQNVLPATGPVSAGGDQGRDFETFRGVSGRRTMVGACTLQKANLPQKIKSDVAAIVDGGPVDDIYIFCAEDLPVAHRHTLERWAQETHNVHLEIIDGNGLSTQLATPALYEHARKFLRLPSWEMLSDTAVPEGKHSTECMPNEPSRFQPALPQPLHLAQVRDAIVPRNGLRGREKELAELGQFCRGEESYLWLQADPWAGKSALLSSFAVDPPADLTVFCCFITGSLPQQNDHFAFTEAVLDQVAAYLPHYRPTIDATTTNRDGLRRQLLDAAAETAETQGRRLVLIVDGLDEDNGVPPVSTLLPANPHPNLRIIVASRYGPPLTIPRGHPLESCERRRLAPSPHAENLKQQAFKELDEALRFSAASLHVLRLITVARGLSTAELEELTELPPFEIHRVTFEIAGRSLRASKTLNDDAVFALAHETLQCEAERHLGRRLLKASLEELNCWAERYQEKHWPEDTPDFLLERYFAALSSCKDLTHMTALALDTTRHDRLFTTTGTDAAAVYEIRTTQQHIVDSGNEDLLAMGRLAIRRDRLKQRASRIPDQLPLAWAAIGEFDRAETLSRMLANSSDEASALLLLVPILIAQGEHNRSRRLIEAAEAMPDSGASPDTRLRTLVSIAELWAAAGDHDRAIRAAHSSEVFAMGDPPALRIYAWVPVAEHQLGPQAASDHGTSFPLDPRPNRVFEESQMMTMLCRLVKVHARAGNRAHAREIASMIAKLADGSRGSEHLIGLLKLAQACVAVGDPSLIRQLIGEAQALADTMVNDYSAHLDALVRLAETCAVVGEHDHARNLVDQIESIASLEDLRVEARDSAYERLARASVLLGTFDHAEDVAGRISDHRVRVRVLEGLITARLRADDVDDARATLRRLEAVVSECGPNGRLASFTHLAMALVATGDYERAELIGKTHLITFNPRFGPLGLIWLVRNLAEAGENRRARSLMDLAESLTYRNSPPTLEMNELEQLVTGLAAAGDTAMAGQLVDHAERSIRGLDNPDKALERLVPLWVRASHVDRAEALARSFANPAQQESALTSLARQLAATGDQTRAERIASDASIPAFDIRPNPSGESTSTCMIKQLMATGDYAQAEKLIPHLRHWDQRTAQIEVAKAWACSGGLERAESFADSLSHPDTRARALTEIAKEAPREAARRLIINAWFAGRWSTPLSALANIDPPTLRAIAHDTLAMNIRP
ncbi:hypothetical protein [Nocardia beijingensis]